MTFSTWKQKIISKRHTASHTQVTHGMSFISSGTGIRTPTYRVRVCCATVTQYRYLEYCLSAIRFVLGCSPDVIYYNSSSSFCQYLFIIFLRFFQVFSRFDLNEKRHRKIIRCRFSMIILFYFLSVSCARPSISSRV